MFWVALPQSFCSNKVNRLMPGFRVEPDVVALIVRGYRRFCNTDSGFNAVVVVVVDVVNVVLFLLFGCLFMSSESELQVSRGIVVPIVFNAVGGNDPVPIIDAGKRGFMLNSNGEAWTYVVPNTNP